MANSRKCSRGKKYKRSYKRSNGTKVKGHCYSPKKSSKRVSKKTSRKVSRKRSSPRRACPAGMTWRKSHVRSSGKKVKGRCVKTKASRFFTNLTPSAPSLYVEEPKAFIASSLLPIKRQEGELEMPPLESYGFGFGSCGAM